MGSFGVKWSAFWMFQACTVHALHRWTSRHVTDSNILLNSFQRPAQIQYTIQSLVITALMFVNISAYLILPVNIFVRISRQNTQIRKFIFKMKPYKWISFLFIYGRKSFFSSNICFRGWTKSILSNEMEIWASFISLKITNYIWGNEK